MDEPQATREKEGARRKLLLQISHRLTHPKEICEFFPVALGLASVRATVPDKMPISAMLRSKDTHHFPDGWSCPMRLLFWEWGRYKLIVTIQLAAL